MRGIFFSVVVFTLCCSSIVHAQVPFGGTKENPLPKRLALVIGVDNYKNPGSLSLLNLPGASTDARSVSSMLEKIGFDVTLLTSSPEQKYISKEDIGKAISDLATMADDARKESGVGAVVAVYYAGHGVSIDGKSYILHSNFFASTSEDAVNNSIDLETNVVKMFESSQPILKLIIIDACRTSLPKNLPRLSGGTVTISPGLSIKPSDPSNMQLAKNHTSFLFSSLVGTPAIEAGDIGGVFTSKLVRKMRNHLSKIRNHPDDPNKPSLRDVFEETRTDMVALAVKKQVPQLDETVSSKFFPFPTEFDFKLEKTTFDNIMNVPLVGFQNYNEVRDKRICDLTRMLNDFSQYSYFSSAIIEEINSRPKLPALNCDADTDLNPSINSSLVPDVPVLPKSEVPTILHKGNFDDNTLIIEYFLPAISVDGDSNLKLVEIQLRETSSDLPNYFYLGEVQPLTRELTIGDLKKLLLNDPDRNEFNINLADEAKLLDTVVATKPVLLRSAPEDTSVSSSFVSAGELLHILFKTSDTSWMLARNVDNKIGYVKTSDVQPLLSQIAKTLLFQAGDYDLTDSNRTEISAAFGLMGGIAIAEASVEFSAADSKIGFVRATAIRNYLENIFASKYGSAKSRVYVNVKEDRTGIVPAGNVRISVLGVPLKQSVRAAFSEIRSKGFLELGIQGANDNSDKFGPPGQSLQFCKNGTCKSTSTDKDIDALNSAVITSKQINRSSNIESRAVNAVRNLKMFKF